MTRRIRERPSLRDRERKDEPPEKLLQILMGIYPEELALEIFKKLIKGNDDMSRLEREENEIKT